MKYIVLLTVVFTVAACATPKTVLKNEKTGQVAVCGGEVTGSLVGGFLGYSIQKSNDNNCVVGYHNQGFSIVEQEK